MSYPINYPTPQGANVQIVYRDSDWVKPQGASFVWFTLIGGGGTGNGTSGGGSGAVTNFMCPAFLIPDVLQIRIGFDGGSTAVFYREKTGAGYNLFQAVSGQATSGGTASTISSFMAAGIFQSVAGQNGSSGNVSASATTFLSGGGASSSTITANYGYLNDTGFTNRRGTFQIQPIIVGVGGMGTGNGNIGCGGGSDSGPGGPGLAVIITW